MTRHTQAEQRVPIEVTVNGRTHRRTVEARDSLADLLRDGLELHGTKVGCEHGVCGSCTVIVDGVSMRSCLMLAAQADGTVVRTVEDLADGRELSDVQESFREHQGVQCGFCTAGFLMTTTEMLDAPEMPDDAELLEALTGNICRCTGYETIVTSVLAVAAQRREATV